MLPHIAAPWPSIGIDKLTRWFGDFTFNFAEEQGGQDILDLTSFEFASFEEAIETAAKVGNDTASLLIRKHHSHW